MAVSDAAVIFESLANFLSDAKASSPESRTTTRISARASPATFVLFIGVTPRFAVRDDFP
jgi:hypothetical protein